MPTPWEEERAPVWFNSVALLISVTAAVTAFLPMALDTSPWDAVRLRVPGNRSHERSAFVCEAPRYPANSRLPSRS